MSGVTWSSSDHDQTQSHQYPSCPSQTVSRSFINKLQKLKNAAGWASNLLLYNQSMLTNAVIAILVTSFIIARPPCQAALSCHCHVSQILLKTIKNIDLLQSQAHLLGLSLLSASIDMTTINTLEKSSFSFWLHRNLSFHLFESD